MVSATIRHSVHVIADLRPGCGIRLVYSKAETVATIDELQHDLARAALGMLAEENNAIRKGIEIFSVGDLPERMGLGSSGAYTVALVQAVSALGSMNYTARSLARRASQIEMELCGRPIGFQDQVASAYGGLRLYTFGENGEEEFEDLGRYGGALERRTLLVDIGPRRKDSTVLQDMSNNMEDSRARATLRSMANLALSFRDALVADKLDECGEIVDAAWNLKKTLGGTSSEEAEAMYKFAKANGAIGGKVCGAGGHGMMLFICRAGTRSHLYRRIVETNYRSQLVTPHFLASGSRIVYST